MFFKRHLSAFNIYIFLLILSISILINSIVEFPIINTTIYLFLHLLMIYLGIYYLSQFLFFIFFITGIICDIFLLNELGPHMISFMLLALLLSQIRKTILNLNPMKIILIFSLLYFLTLICEIVLSFFFFNYNFNIENIKMNIFIFLLIFYPTFYFFSKIDKLG